jgi:hypothetical protein
MSLAASDECGTTWGQLFRGGGLGTSTRQLQGHIHKCTASEMCKHTAKENFHAMHKKACVGTAGGEDSLPCS